jgi:hypothetical protein
LFTLFTKQVNDRPAVTIDGVDIPLCRTPKILQVIFDTLFCFRNHVLEIRVKACQRLNIMQAVSGTSWGHGRETLLITYRAFVESVINYACPIWFPNCKPSNICRLQFIQNAALRLVTGCLKAAPIDHLHAKAKLMLVADHLSMLCLQFIASCMRPCTLHMQW